MFYIAKITVSYKIIFFALFLKYETFLPSSDMVHCPASGRYSLISFVFALYSIILFLIGYQILPFLISISVNNFFLHLIIVCLKIDVFHSRYISHQPEHDPAYCHKKNNSYDHAYPDLAFIMRYLISPHIYSSSTFFIHILFKAPNLPFRHKDCVQPAGKSL